MTSRFALGVFRHAVYDIFEARFVSVGVSADGQRCTSVAVLKSVSQIESPKTSLFQISLFLANATTFFMQTNQILIL